MRPRDVDALIAHATSTPKGDLAEIRAINTMHAAERPVTSFKGHIGHSGAATGGMGLVAAVATPDGADLPHTAGSRDLDPSIDFAVVVGDPLAVEAEVIQLNAFGFGGQNASLVVRRPH